MENLCQRFEIDPESVLLENENPNVISNVLKLYLRQLPEPLLTFKYYQHFIQVAKVSCYINTPIIYTKFFAAVKKNNLFNKLHYPFIWVYIKCSIQIKWKKE